MEKEIATLIRTSNDLDFAFVLELWEIICPNGTSKELQQFLKDAGF